jgi:hypothetical protein
MAIFRVPKITSDQRTQLVLSASEIVYDLDRSAYFGGDGSVVGGFEIGKTAGLKMKKETFSLEIGNVIEKKVYLTYLPEGVQNVRLIPEGGIEQNFGIDFTVVQNELSWANLGLDGFLEVDDIINVIYFHY